MRSLLPPLLAASFLLAAPARAEESAPWELQSPRFKLVNAAFVYPQRISGYPTWHDRLEGESEWNLANMTFSIRLTPWAWVDVPHAVGGLERKPSAFLEAKEGWAQYSHPSFDIKLGNQLFTWGAADGINPTDVWNPSDLTDPFYSSKLPILAARVSVHPTFLDWATLEMIGTPFFRESRLPISLPDVGTTTLDPNGSRWLVVLPAAVQSGTFQVPLKYELAAPTYSATYQFGARFGLGLVPGWDFSLSGYTGVEKTPRFCVARRGDATDPALPIIATLNPSFHRQQMLGLDGQGTLFENALGVRFEAAYHFRDNSRTEGLPETIAADLKKDDFVHAVVGADYTAPKPFLWSVHYFNLMYVFYETVTRRGETTTTSASSGISGLPASDPFDRNVVLYLENRFSDTYKLATMTIFAHRSLDLLVNPAFHAQLTDRFKLVLGGDLFLGSSDGFYGQFADNKRIKLVATYEW